MKAPPGPLRRPGKSAPKAGAKVIRELEGWRGKTLARIRALYTKIVELTFARGARISDPKRLFGSRPP